MVLDIELDLKKERKMKNVVNWFEIATKDFDRAKKFYSKILDRNLEVMQMNETVKLAMLGETNDPSVVTGALITGNGSVPSDQGTLVFLNAGDDLSGILGKVEVSGGKVVVPKTEIPGGFGHFAKFSDTEGNHIGLHSKN